MKKTLIAVVSTVLICCCVFGGTLAWLTAKSATVTNTFTFGDIEIKLDESTLTSEGTLDTATRVTAAQTYKVIPGVDYKKDPTITFTAESEACWLFVKIDETVPSGLSTTVFSYTNNAAWTKLEDGVYYIKITSVVAENTAYHVLADDTVTINSNLTADDIDIVNTTNPKLAFTAYAVQLEAADNAAAAWAIANP